MTDITTLVGGIDTSKDTPDMAIHGRDGVLHVPNAAPGWKKIAAELEKHAVQRIGIEATGGYERGVIRHLRARGHTVTLL